MITQCTYPTCKARARFTVTATGYPLPQATPCLDQSGVHIVARRADTLGWTDCGHGFYRPGLALDPFAGTGTTLCVAELHGRDSIGLDIDAQGVNRKLPHLGNAGQGVNRQLPHLGNAGRAGFWTLEARAQGLVNYFTELADRLRDVRVCCGDYSRVLTNGALSFGATVGVFVDPPYLGDVRTADLYAVDDHSIAHDVREWCLANGDNPRYRIVLAGYTDEHDHLMPDTWRRIYWSSSASYQTTASAERNADGDTSGNLGNRHKECLWLSPACIHTTHQLDLFGAV